MIGVMRARLRSGLVVSALVAGCAAFSATSSAVGAPTGPCSQAMRCLSLDGGRFDVTLPESIVDAGGRVGVQIDDVITGALKRISALLPGPSILIQIVPGVDVIPGLGVVGATGTTGEVAITVDTAQNKSALRCTLTAGLV